MRFLFLGLSILVGTLTGLLYDLQVPVISLGVIHVSGPALATSILVSLILACSLIATSVITTRLNRLSGRHDHSLMLPTGPAMPRFGVLDGGRSEGDVMAKTITATRRLPIVDLANLELRAER